MDCEARTCAMVALLTFVRPALTAGDAEKLPDVEINKLLRLANICVLVVVRSGRVFWYSRVFAPALRSPTPLQHLQSV